MKDKYWTTDDITFCSKDCDCEKCMRNKIHIHHQEIPHWFAEFEGTRYCKLSGEKK